MKAMLASGQISREIDPVALRLLLTFGSIYQPQTMLRGVKMLLPAHRMIVENGQVRIERYWSLELNRIPDFRNLDYPDQVQYLSEALADAVRLHMVSDVPLGAFLSGGVDSSILVSLMAREAGRRIKTFSVGFESEGADIDESGDAQRTARYLGTDHTHVLVRGTEVRERIFQIASALDQPSVDGVNSYFVSRAARQGMTVAISGTGGDELFAGYPWFLNMTMEEERPIAFWGNALSAMAGQPVFDVLLWSRMGNRLYRARTIAGFLNRYALQYQIFGSAGAARMISPAMRYPARAGRPEMEDLRMIDELENGSILERVTGLCLRGYTCNQLLRDIDATSMSHSLEVRVPYLDTHLVDLALSLPDGAKLTPAASADGAHRTYRSTGAKRILIDAGRALLPKDFDIQPKRGFAMPFESWLKGPLADVFLDSVSENTVRARGWFDARDVTRIKTRFSEGRIGWAQPWLLMMVELWARQVLNPSDGE
jgi:asparagine synthase (glutamine-hydrolysing)